MTRAKLFSGILISICFGLFLSACSNGESESKDTKKEEVRTATDAMGEVTIPANAERILAPNMEDSLLALGITPPAQWAIGTTVHNYLQPQLKDVPTIEWDLPLEQTINAKPDIIIFGSPGSIQNGKYEEYKKIAPTYVFKEEESADWRKQLQVMGEIAGKEKEAKAVLEDYDAKTKEQAAELKTAIGDETAAILWVIGKQYYLFENSRFAANVLYTDLGVTQPEMIKALPKAEAAWNPISLEALSDLDADHIFLASLPNEPGLASLKASSVWKGLPAVKAGKIYEMEDPSNWTSNGPIANNITMDQIVSVITKK
ncbi:ferrichrome ABC transporter substrate-binding protein [Peribacillus saganii]|uniref:Ferrichrome ABC transporter substrate-binding protein n=1 Tax=Peribacillus saganii TaxID=2303992 RepID=A0A372LL84_9BACI|nr:ABC transporter substrate-binding protein [Peribacillus saganii]RFU67588.1 ferrichrome ABC transporter substrate-binding protein [Peribacillus saganii]